MIYLLTQEQKHQIEDALRGGKIVDEDTQARRDSLAIIRSLKPSEPVGEIRSVVWGGMAWSVGFVAHTKPELRTKLYAPEKTE